MKTCIKEGNIVKFTFISEEKDKPNPLGWAMVALDQDEYILFSITSCGNYIYQWVPVQEKESFIQLLTRVDFNHMICRIAA